MLSPFLIGLALGVFVTSVVAWFTLRGHTRREVQAERRARAAERMAEIGAMTGGLAHEIKNPLSTIGLNAQLLAESIEDLELPDDERSRLLNRIRALRREVDRLSGILADFLEYAGQVHLDRSTTDANELVRDLIDFYSPEAERRGVRILTDLHNQPITASIDVKRVKQAVLNLMLNATQAMEAGTGSAKELILRTSPAAEPDGTEVVRIDVTDTGPGIPPDKLAEIFKPYFSLRSGGSGLGLPTARLVEAHDGRIEVHSEVGKGTGFAVVLPLQRSRPE